MVVQATDIQFEDVPEAVRPLSGAQGWRALPTNPPRTEAAYLKGLSLH